ncbi:MAG: methionine--tRNA ligase [Ignavibacteria bacterium]
MSRTLITAALPYVNSYIHLGHLAGAYLPADMYARFLRLSGREVLFVCGSDEHGVAITISAEKEKTTPQAIIDKYHPMNEQSFATFGMSFDIYSRTSLPTHHDTAREFFLDWLEKGLLTEKEEPQFFDESANMFLPDRYVEGICPNCKKDGARGDQCDSCGTTYEQTALIDPKSVISGKTPIVKSTKHWYFKMGEFQKPLEEYIESHANDWKENVLQQSRSWLKQGLNDRAATRDMQWGIKVPVEGADGKVIYVWFEAVLGYISATKHWAQSQGLEPDAWKEWWSEPKGEDRNYVAFLGKDNIVFHTLIFPMLLMSKGDMILPQYVPANEFLNFEGKKFSKSNNWGIFLRDYQKDFPGESNTDILRYALATNLPESKDSDFTWKDFQAKTNNELAAIPGNFINRVTQFLTKNFEGKVPNLEGKYAEFANKWHALIDWFNQKTWNSKEEMIAEIPVSFSEIFNEHDLLMIASLYWGMHSTKQSYLGFRLRDAVMETMNIARSANKYFNDCEPWKSIKTNPEEAAKTLYVCSQVLNALSIAFAPIIPHTAKSIAIACGQEPKTGDHSSIGLNVWNWIAQPVLQCGQHIAQPPILFNKLEDSVIEEKIQSMEQAQQPAEELISIEDFKKVKLRTAKIIHAEAVPKSEKLVKLQVDLGNEQRQILAGIAKHYAPESLIGKTIVVVANLKPAKLMGMESQGMLLAANAEDGSLGLVIPEIDVIGSEVR